VSQPGILRKARVYDGNLSATQTEKKPGYEVYEAAKSRFLDNDIALL
jgi:hypothetical protein